MKMPVFAVNRKLRTERRSHILREFEGRDEFMLQIIDAIEDENGAWGLWQTIRKIVQEHGPGNEFLILCEDDHLFTEHYSKEFFFSVLQRALQRNADIVLGGVSYFDIGLQLNNDLFWLNVFNGLQFTVISERMYEKILHYEFQEDDHADYVLSALTENAFLIFPFISVQKEFGYTDISKKRKRDKSSVEPLFNDAIRRLELIRNVSRLFHVL
jgi:glycosyl transferase family 25